MIEKIISGGQTGADQGGLFAGLILGITTGGTAPPNFMTDTGPKKEFLISFGLIEGVPDPSTYPKRTWENVKNSDGTALFGNLYSPGTRLTMRYCKTLLKPYIKNPLPSELREFINQYSIIVLNIAGNRERTNPGITKRVTDTIVEALRVLRSE